MKKYGNNNKPKDDESTQISQRIIQYVDDPKNSSALAKIHEMSDKAKRTGISPAQLRRSYIKNMEKNENKQIDINYNHRRSQHFPTVKEQSYNYNFLNKDYSNKIIPPKDTQKDKKDFISDKSYNRRVEKDQVNNTRSQVNNTRTQVNNTRSQVNNTRTQVNNTRSQIDNPRPQVNNARSQVNNTRSQKVETKVETHTKNKYQNDTEPIKEDQDKEDKGEIIDKLREYKQKRELEGKNKKRIKIQVPKGNQKFSEIVYEKKNISEDEDDEDFKDLKDSGKNTKFYKKIVKNGPNSKTVITKKIIEENIEQKFNFDNDSDDDEDIRRELKKLKLNPSQVSKENVKVKIITEEYDEKGNKIYSKEFTTNKLPKGLKGNDEIMDEFEKFEDEFDE